MRPDPRQMNWTMRTGHLRMARDDAAWIAEMIEHRGSESLSDIARLLRARAQAAFFRAKLFLAALLVVTLFGLGAYVLWPIVRGNFDGQRAELTRTLAALDQVDATLTAQREKLRKTLADALDPAGIPIDTGTGSRLTGHILLRSGQYLLYGQDGTILRLFPDGEVDTAIRSGTKEWLIDHIALSSGRYLIHGTGGTLLRLSSDGEVEKIPVETKATLRGSLILPSGHHLVYGGKGKLLRLSPDGDVEKTILTETEVDLYFGITLPSGQHLIFGDDSILLRMSPEGEESKVIRLGMDFNIFGHIPLPSGQHLIFGEGGTLLRLQSEGEVDKTIQTGTEADLFGHILLPSGQHLIYGTGGDLLRLSPEGNVEKLIKTGTDGWPSDHITLPSGNHLIFFSGGSRLRLSPDGDVQETIQDSTGTWISGSIRVPSNQNLVYGENGIIQLLSLDGTVEKVLPTVTETDLLTHLQLPSGQNFIFGDSGVLLRVSDELANTARNLRAPYQGASEADGDGLFTQFLVRDLEKFDFNERTDAIEAMQVIRAKREITQARRDQTEAALRNLPTGAYFLEQQRQTFRQFMADCRGYDPEAEEPDVARDGEATDPDAVTLACTAAWQARAEADAGSQWQLLAQQIPPGVLLLFLLGHLGGLYRYNQRLAGFHASRADLVELLHLRTGGDTGKITREQLEQIVMLSDALGADKVEFGAQKTPTDQAVELARAIATRKP